MNDYRVTWSIDLRTDSPEHAARLAREYQRDPEAHVGHFEVFDLARPGNMINIDLDVIEGRVS